MITDLVPDPDFESNIPGWPAEAAALALAVDSQAIREVMLLTVNSMRPTRRMVMRYQIWEKLSFAEMESRFAANGVDVDQQTLKQWYAEGLMELVKAVRAAKELQREISLL